MQVMIDIPEQALSEAAALGITLQVYAERLVSQAREDVCRERGWNRGTPEEFIKSITLHGRNMGVLPPEAFSRKNIYADED